MILYPNAKINLGLRVLRKRSDGYHDIETLFYPVPWTDILEVILAKDGEFSFSATGFPIPGTQQQNLCVRAYERLREQGLRVGPVKIHLHKQIPTGSGLGGGSSDAAFTLNALNKLFDLGLEAPELALQAAALGSDCPFFLWNTPAFATGRGEVLTPAPVSLKGMFLVLVIPPVSVSTSFAYSKVKPAVPEIPLQEIILKHRPEEWKRVLVNDFEEPVFREFPAIGEVKERLLELGAVYASMSGSGSAVYGLFREPPARLAGFPTDCLVFTRELE